MSRIVDVEPLDCLAWKDGEHGTTFDDGVLWVLEKIGELPAVQTCEDAVSRQAAIDAMDDIESEVADGFGFQYEKWREYFCELPSAQPERKKGEWLADPNEFDEWYCCSVCHKGLTMFDGTYDFCPNCGAKMEGDKDENKNS